MDLDVFAKTVSDVLCLKIFVDGQITPSSYSSRGVFTDRPVSLPSTPLIKGNEKKIEIDSSANRRPDVSAGRPQKDPFGFAELGRNRGHVRFVFFSASFLSTSSYRSPAPYVRRHRRQRTRLGAAGSRTYTYDNNTHALHAAVSESLPSRNRVRSRKVRAKNTSTRPDGRTDDDLTVTPAVEMSVYDLTVVTDRRP